MDGDAGTGGGRGGGKCVGMRGERDVDRDVYLDVPVDVVSPRYYRKVRTLFRRRLISRRRWRSYCRRWNGRRGRRGATLRETVTAIQIHTTPFLTINQDAVLALRAVSAATTALAPIGCAATFATFEAGAACAAREAAGVA